MPDLESGRSLAGAESSSAPLLDVQAVVSSSWRLPFIHVLLTDQRDDHEAARCRRCKFRELCDEALGRTADIAKAVGLSRALHRVQAGAMDLFTPVTTKDRLHPNFTQTLAPSASPVRAILSGWAEGFVDRDGKFVHEFQTTYNSAFWELYLFAVLKELGIQVDLVHSSPDFVCVNPALVIEAAIASHARDDTPEWRKDMRTVIRSDTDAANRQTIIRLSNAFLEKARRYNKAYSRLPHVPGKPFIVALSNYGTQEFAFSGDVPMQHLLYDPAEERRILKPNGSAVELGLFRSDLYSCVSAVLYSSVATFGKARVLSKGGENFFVQAIRIKDNDEIIPIFLPKNKYSESLTDGLRLFVNPFADIPVDIDAFDDPGIRIFLPDCKGGLSVSCHAYGDLCMRIVHQIVTRD